jgi:hypothetical protein
VILFPHSYSGDDLGAMHLGLRLSTHAEKETRSVVEKIYGMAYIFTLLMFRKSNKTIINKNNTTIFLSVNVLSILVYI